MAAGDDVDAHPAAARHAMGWLALLCVVLVIHGSLYPWQFAWPASLSAAWHHMMNQRSWWTGRGDVVGNVVLFVPVGVLGWLLLQRSRVPMLLATALLIGAGVVFAFALQVAQLFVPARDAAWSDVVWNTLGLLAGPLLAAPLVRLSTSQLQARALRAPLTFVVLWLLLEWWPFVPRLDWQHVKDALKPLLLHPQWRTLGALEAALSLGVVGLMLRPLRQRAGWLIVLPLAAAIGALTIEGRVLTLSRSVGWLCGLLLAWQAWRLHPRVAAALGASVALLGFTVDGLRPFQLGESLAEFQWVPFMALLQGSLQANTLALTWQLFWLGAVMVLLHSISAPASAVAFALSLWSLALELLQMLLPGRMPDITPALLPWLWCLALPLLHVSLPPAVTKSLPRVQINPPSHAP
ncbi:MAG TPA: VanZ family protein [Burkholderiaceae bacterium]|nr:VanZ family protein [Burkholderiaceae bacterium]